MNNQSKNKKPPKFAEYLMSRMFPDDNYYTTVSDLEEDYKYLLSEKGKIYSGIWYRFQLFPACVHCFNNKLKWSFVMLKNYLRIAARNLKKYKSYSFINITGLTLGITSSLLILAYVNFEFSFDKFHSKAERIYRFAAAGTIGGNDYNSAMAPAFVYDNLISDYPEVKNAVRFCRVNFESFRYKENKNYEHGFFYTDGSVFDIFDFKLVRGNSETALKLPYSIVITEETADKYFLNEDPIGKRIKCQEQFDLEVTGIIKKLPANSHLQFDALVSMETMKKEYSHPFEHPVHFDFMTYFLLKNTDDIKTFKLKIDGFYNKRFEGQPEMSEYRLWELLQPVTSVHLKSNLNNDTRGNVDIKYMYGLIAAAVLILLIACINYVNLSTARTSQRAREIGMRKVLGAFKTQITLQFFGESFFHVLLAFVSGFILVILIFPTLQYLSGYKLSITFLKDPMLLLESFLMLIFISIASSGYSAFFLSGVRPVKTLKGIIIEKKGSSKFRNVLVVFQFLISISLITGTIGILSQLNYLKNKDLGFNKKNLIYFPVYTDRMEPGKVQSWVSAVKSEMIAINGVQNVSLSTMLPVFDNVFKDSYTIEGISEDKKFGMVQYDVEKDFLKTMETEMNNSYELGGEFNNGKSNSIIINESAAKLIGLENPVGRILKAPWGDKWKIIGISKDFHCRSLHFNIDPMIFTNDLHYHYMIIRLKSGNLMNALVRIKNIWDKFEPAHTFEYTFMDEKINSLYTSEAQLGKIIQIFTILAVIISCLGMYGFISYVTELRTKEIGIRKTFGASAANIVNSFVKNLSIWVITACILAFPVSYFLLNSWLKNFAYRIDIGLKIFVLSGFAAFCIAFFTVIYQTLKAASSNPVNSLRRNDQ